MPDFAQFMTRRDQIAASYVNADAEPLREIAATDGEVTFFSPGGGHLEGAAQVWDAYERGAAGFSPGGNSKLEVLQSGASGDLAYWVGIQRANVRLGDNPDVVPFDVRVTEVFRRDGDSWKLVH